MTKTLTVDAQRVRETAEEHPESKCLLKALFPEAINADRVIDHDELHNEWHLYEVELVDAGTVTAIKIADTILSHGTRWSMPTAESMMCSTKSSKTKFIFHNDLLGGASANTLATLNEEQLVRIKTAIMEYNKCHGIK